jgi:hypothetical protein
MKPVAEMSESEACQVRAWARNWAELTPVLEEMRAEQIRSADTEQALRNLDDAFDSAVWLQAPRPSSGLIEQQALFARARK